MTDERVAPWIVRKIEEHLGGIFAAGFAGFAAYLIGTTTTSHRIEELESDVAELKADMKVLTPRVDRMEIAAQLEREERLKGDAK